MKKFCILFLSILMILMVGCGNDNKTSDNTNQNSNVTQESSEQSTSGKQIPKSMLEVRREEYKKNSVNNEEIFVGKSDSTGRDCYLLTNSIKFSTTIQDNDCVDCTVKMVKSKNDIQYLNYKFTFIHSDNITFENDQGFSGKINEKETPIEYKTYSTAMRGFFNILNQNSSNKKSKEKIVFTSKNFVLYLLEDTVKMQISDYDNNFHLIFRIKMKTKDDESYIDYNFNGGYNDFGKYISYNESNGKVDKGYIDKNDKNNHIIEKKIFEEAYNKASETFGVIQPADIYCGTSTERDGYSIPFRWYLVTDSVARNGNNFKCIVKMVNPNDNTIMYTGLTFFETDTHGIGAYQTTGVISIINTEESILYKVYEKALNYL